MSGAAGLWAVGTALPRYWVSQEQALRFMKEQCGEERAVQRRLDYLYRRSRIEGRYSCCGDFAGIRDAKGAIFLHKEPGIAERMRRFEQEIGLLARRAAEAALEEQQRYRATDITHLVVVTCTGFAAPGPDLGLIEGLGLRRDVRRLQVGFMGCQAALPALQAADAICRSEPEAVVLVVCAELCTLHFCRETSQENLIVNSLFGDGAAAAIAASTGQGERPLCIVEHFASQVVPQERELVSWRIGDGGFRMGLALNAPERLRALLPGFVEELLKGAGRVQEEIHLWAVHPGGRAILDAVERCLGLEGQDLAASREVLRACGNMSSPSVLFVLEKLLSKGTGRGAMLSFGPGLSLEGMVWQQGA